jgi:hypothetical protein
VGFLKEPDRIVGETTNGQFYAWPFFKDRDALINFAQERLPLNEKGETIRLSQKDKCRLGVVTTQCSPSPRDMQKSAAPTSCRGNFFNNVRDACSIFE